MIFVGPILSERVELLIRKYDILELKKKAKEHIGLSSDRNLVLFIPSGVKKAKVKFIWDFINLLSEFKNL